MSNTTDIKRGHWTYNELQMVRELYPTMDTGKLAAMLHRARSSVKAQASRMGIHKAVPNEVPKSLPRPRATLATIRRRPKAHVPPRLCHSCVNYPCFDGIDNLETDFAKAGCHGYKQREPQQLNPS